MKKLVFLSALLSMTLVACGDDDKPAGENPNTQPKLEGKWNLIQSETIEDGTSTKDDLKPGNCDYDYYNLKTGGTKDEVYHDEDNDCAKEEYPGTWSYDAAKKQITMIDSDDNYTLITEVVSLTTTDLKVKLVSADGETPPAGTEAYLYLKR